MIDIHVKVVDESRAEATINGVTLTFEREGQSTTLLLYTESPSTTVNKAFDNTIGEIVAQSLMRSVCGIMEALEQTGCEDVWNPELDDDVLDEWYSSVC